MSECQIVRMLVVGVNIYICTYVFLQKFDKLIKCARFKQDLDSNPSLTKIYCAYNASKKIVFQITKIYLSWFKGAPSQQWGKRQNQTPNPGKKQHCPHHRHLSPETLYIFDKYDQPFYCSYIHVLTLFVTTVHLKIEIHVRESIEFIPAWYKHDKTIIFNFYTNCITVVFAEEAQCLFQVLGVK